MKETFSKEKRIGQFSIYLNAIGKINNAITNSFKKIEEPLILFGAGEYNLNVVKEEIATSSFMDLDSKGCQNHEPYENCTTRAYREEVMKICNCAPFSIANENVEFSSLKQT